MSQNVRRMNCRAEDVFDVLRDGWVYPVWVVGAARMRAVDALWPQAGAKLHHSVGPWPMLIDDVTVSEEWEPPRRMVMTARGWPIGEARVTIEVRPSGDAHCIVRIGEDAVSGPARVIPKPIRDVLLHGRNTETLRRLAYLAEGRARSGVGGTAPGEDPDIETASDQAPPPTAS
ncbi:MULTISPECIES: SRPBCC family protein [Microbacterium]|uniref:Polyketide cyclase / dehydrase and lipid transport n=1 Tax=Microbacterium saccharophilum TaxID=1213358 RepID=A0A7Z7GFI5_9MICO|nr:MULTISPECIES: SRPBCC family protein [Microbacterium]SFI58253.1 Polyketide cyclase / dehydrase and lipid transport [Microbacterium saccharophilum]